jgi:hypothetical protein
VSTEQELHRRRAFRVAVLATIIVAVLLGFNGYRTLEQDRDTALAQGAVNSWLEGTAYSFTRVSLNYQTEDVLVSGPAHAVITIAGTGEHPDIDQLAQSMEETLGYPVTIELRVLPEQVKYFPKILRRTPVGS